MTQDEEHAAAVAEPGPAIPVCPKCMAEVLPWMDFCMRCRSPLTAFANTGPMESAFSEGWGIGEAIVTKRPSLVSLIGLWLLVAPSVVVPALMLFRPSLGPLSFGELVERAFAGIFLAFGGWALFHATRNYVRARRGRTEPRVG